MKRTFALLSALLIAFSFFCSFASCGKNKASEEKESDPELKSNDLYDSVYGSYDLSEYLKVNTAFPEIEYDENELKNSMNEYLQSCFYEVENIVEVTDNREIKDSDILDVSFTVIYNGYAVEPEDGALEELGFAEEPEELLNDPELEHTDEVYEIGQEVGYLAKTNFTLKSDDSDLGFLMNSLVGHRKGDEVGIRYTVPDDFYTNIFLRGKEVIYRVTVNTVSESLPIDVDFITDEHVTTYTDFESKEEFVEKLTEYYLKNMIWDKVLENTEYYKYPDAVVDERYFTEVRNLGINARAAGLSEDEYVQQGVKTYSEVYGTYVTYTYKDAEEYLSIALSSIKTQVGEEMLIYKLAKDCGVKCDDPSLENVADVATNVKNQLLDLAVKRAVPVN